MGHPVFPSQCGTLKDFAIDHGGQGAQRFDRRACVQHHTLVHATLTPVGRAVGLVPDHELAALRRTLARVWGARTCDVDTVLAVHGVKVPW